MTRSVRVMPPRLNLFQAVGCILICFGISKAFGSAVIDVEGPTGLQKFVHDTTAPVLVSYQPGSDDDKLNDLIDQVEARVGAFGVVVARVDCSTKENKRMCASAGLRTLPSFQVFVEAPSLNPYTKKRFRNGIFFEHNQGGGLDSRALERFIGKNIPDVVTRVTSTSELKTKLSSPSSASFSLVLLSDKTTVSMLIKSVANSFSSRQLPVYQMGGVAVDEINAMLDKSFEGLPQLGLVSSSSPLALHSVFDGDLHDRKSIMEWIQSVTKLEEGKVDPNVDAEDKTTSGGDHKSPEDQPAAVKSYSSSEFTEESLPDSEVWLVHVVSESSPKGDEWKKLTSWCEGVIKSAILLCSSTEGLGLGSKLCRARDLPFVAVIPHGSSARKKFHATPEKGSYVFALSETESIKKAALESLPESAVHSMGEDGLQLFLQDVHNTKELLPVMILSDKSTAPAMLRNLALSLEKFSQVAFVTSPSKDFLKNIGNPRLPTAIAMFSAAPEEGQQPGFQVVVYDHTVLGPMRFQSLQNFVLQTFSRSSLAEGYIKRQNAAAGGSASIAGEVQKDLFDVTKEAEWNEHCGTSFRGICAVGLLSSEAESAASASSALNAVMADLGRSGAAFRFITVDGECQYGFANRFDVQLENFPALAAYSPSKGRFAIFRGAFKEGPMKEFLNNILSGKASTIAIPQRPTLAAACDGQHSAAPIADESEESKAEADDFMAEIRREEAERKAQLKKEMQEEEARRKKLEEEEAAAKPAMRKIKRKVKKTKKASTTKEDL